MSLKFHFWLHLLCFVIHKYILFVQSHTHTHTLAERVHLISIIPYIIASYAAFQLKKRKTARERRRGIEKGKNKNNNKNWIVHLCSLDWVIWLEIAVVHIIGLLVSEWVSVNLLMFGWIDFHSHTFNRVRNEILVCECLPFSVKCVCKPFCCG